MDPEPQKENKWENCQNSSKVYGAVKSIVYWS